MFLQLLERRRPMLSTRTCQGSHSQSRLSCNEHLTPTIFGKAFRYSHPTLPGIPTCTKTNTRNTQSLECPRILHKLLRTTSSSMPTEKPLSIKRSSFIQWRPCSAETSRHKYCYITSIAGTESLIGREHVRKWTHPLLSARPRKTFTIRVSRTSRTKRSRVVKNIACINCITNSKRSW